MIKMMNKSSSGDEDEDEVVFFDADAATKAAVVADQAKENKIGEDGRGVEQEQEQEHDEVAALQNDRQHVKAHGQQELRMAQQSLENGREHVDVDGVALVEEKPAALEGMEHSLSSEELKKVKEAEALLLEKRESFRKVSIGWLQTLDDGLKIALAGLVASLALNRKERYSSGESLEENDEQWFEEFVGKVVTSYLGLPQDYVHGMLPLGLMEADPEPLAIDWLEKTSDEDREHAFGELMAQSILEIGTNEKLDRYDARQHWCLFRVGLELGVTCENMGKQELLIAQLVAASQSMNKPVELTEEEKQEQAKKSFARRLKIGAAAVVGATLVGVTGGLALPAIGASLAAFGGTAAATGAFIASASGTALFTTLFTAGGMGLTGYKMHRRIGSSLQEFEFKEMTDGKTGKPFQDGLHVCICITGWCSADDEEGSSEQRWAESATKYRSILGQPFNLVWETKVLKDVSQVLRNFAVNKAIDKAVTETLKTTAFATLLTAIAWPSFVIGAANYIDNSWAVGTNRAKQAGHELARAILASSHGNRPVTLVGYSIGGLALFHCLEYIHAKRNGKCDGSILNVIILGAPITAPPERWAELRRVVSGLFINGYCSSDWILTILYRSLTMSISRIAGLYPVNAPGVTNVDLSPVISSQVDYHDHLTPALDHIFQNIPNLKIQLQKQEQQQQNETEN